MKKERTNIFTNIFRIKSNNTIANAKNKLEKE